MAWSGEGVDLELSILNNQSFYRRHRIGYVMTKGRHGDGGGGDREEGVDLERIMTLPVIFSQNCRDVQNCLSD